MGQANPADELTSGDVATRRAAAERLAESEGLPEMALPLIRATGDEDEQVRQWAAAALEQSFPPGINDLGNLIDLLGDPHEDMAYWAATLIGRLADQAGVAAPALAELVGSARPDNVRERAAWALEKIGPRAECAVPALRRAAEVGEPRLARLAHQAIETILGS